ncbi:MAG: cytidylate kinase-like family protein [Breznakibacter sp.]|nr:cytidylate kinase-like family protein [Breznakibacter sp.]
MENLFLKYMKERSGQKKEPVTAPVYHSPGPVITISREYGTRGLEIAEKLTMVINERNKRLGISKEWRYISKEILEHAARELNMTPELTEQLSASSQNDVFDNLTMFLSDDFYTTNTKVKNTIAKVIYGFAAQGHVVVVGRAAEAIVKDITKSLRIKIAAPLDYRVRVVSEKENITLPDARKKCLDQDKKRQQFRRYFENERPDIDFFDMTYNSSSLSDEEIIEMILIVAETRGFI